MPYPLQVPRLARVERQLDEVQQISEWERAVASLNAEPRTRVMISGSNAAMFAGELATRIAGRYLTMQVFPLTLAEFGELHAGVKGARLGSEEMFRLYLRLGGLPGLLHTDLSELVTDQMLGDIFNTIAVRDIISRHKIRDVPLFQDVARFAMDNLGSPLSAKRIADFLLSSHKAKYLLVGGYAVGFYGYPRATADMDIWVSRTEENAQTDSEMSLWQLRH